VSGPDPDTRLFRLLLRQQTLPPGRFIGELWILANSAPDHEAAGRILTEQLFGISDFSGLEALLDNPKNLSWKSFYRGVLLFALGRYDEAGDEFEKIASSGPDALFNLGMARLAAKDLSAAIKAFKHVLVLDPDYEGAGKILRKLEALSVSW
jgi:tetratricopeptide (TPR) repeat protein